MRPSFINLKTSFFTALLALANCLLATAQTTPHPILVISPHVGEVIDQEEKARFNLFPFYETADFMIGRFMQLPDKQIVLEVVRSNGLTETRNYTQTEFDLTGQLIDAKAANPQPIRPPVNAQAPVYTPNRGGFQAKSQKLAGRVFYVILTDGMKFFATITEKRADEYVFDTQYYGQLTAPFREIRYLKEVENKIRGDAYWIPNPHDSRLFFGPTGRGIPAGEGYAQTVLGYINSVNYGVTNNFSIGGTFLLFPGLPIDESIISLTPKISLPVSKNISLAAGVLYATVFGDNLGIVYGAGTVGNKNDNLTAGLGYGFYNDELSNQPIFMFGGVKRVSNRISLMSENYVVTFKPDPNAFEERQNYGGGLYGLRFIWPRTNLDLASMYLFYPRASEWDTGFFTTFVLPVYVSFTFKFGNRREVGKVY